MPTGPKTSVALLIMCWPLMLVIFWPLTVASFVALGSVFSTFAQMRMFSLDMILSPPRLARPGCGDWVAVTWPDGAALAGYAVSWKRITHSAPQI